MALGDVAGAIEAARDALQREPKLPQAHYMLGLAYVAADKLDDAVQNSLRRCGSIPNWRMRASISASSATGKTICKAPPRRCVTRSLLRLGMSARPPISAHSADKWYVEESEQLLKSVLEQNPNATTVRVNLAVALLSEARPREALELLDDKPVPADPRLAQHWQMQRALALLEVNRTAEARDVIAAIGDVPAALEPLMLWRRVLLALAENDQETARAHAVAMEQAVATTDGLIPEHRIMAHYDLAHFWSRRRDPERTFANWSAGHRQLGRFQPFSRDAYRAFFDATIAVLRPERLHDGPRAAEPRSSAGLHRRHAALGNDPRRADPRRASASASAPASAPHSDQAFNALGGDDPRRRRPHRRARQRRARRRKPNLISRDLHALAPRHRHASSTRCRAISIYLGLVALLLPGRADHPLRARSARHRLVDLHLPLLRPAPLRPRSRRSRLEHRPARAADGALAARRFRNPILTLALKDWVEDFDGTLRRVLDFIDLPYDPACERFYETDCRVRTVSRAQVKQPVNARGLGRWRRYATQLAAADRTRFPKTASSCHRSLPWRNV